MTSDEPDDQAQYDALEKELSEPAKDLPEVFGVDESHTPEPERPEPQQYDARQHGEPEQQSPPRQQEPEQQSPPDLEDDPITHLRQLRDRHASLEAQLHERDFWAAIKQSEDDARGEVGEDYTQAAQFLRDNRMQELEGQFPDRSKQAQILANRHGFSSPADLREAILRRDIVETARHAVANNQSPAASFYELAQRRGYQRKTRVGKSQEAAVVDALERAPDKDAERAWNWYRSQMLLGETMNS